MSHKVTPRAYETKLGNSSAKSVLFCLADIGNETGFGFPSIETIAENTELSVRQVQRIFQIFEDIGLVIRKRKVTVDDRVLKYAFQINLALLGTDLRAAFSASLTQVRGENVPRTQEENVPRTVQGVLGTDFGVPRTEKSVPRTEPPHPLIGGTANEPPIEPPTEPLRGSGKKTASPELPSWLPVDLWNDFKEMRKKTKKPMTAKAEELAIRKLAELQEQGSPPAAVLEQSILRSWQGLFEVENRTNGVNRNGNQNQYRSRSERVIDNITAAAEAVAARHGIRLDGSPQGRRAIPEDPRDLRGEVIPPAEPVGR